ncbi:MAG: hypothetical protein EOM22_17630 [Gammaproteobacteria bacterium]|nr:hypothetical protein [Gammaproteobacteria bacterium]
MAPVRYSIYSSEALERVLSERMPHGDADGNLRSRSATITAMCDRYGEVCRRSMPTLPLASWLLIFDAMNGTWLMDHPAMAAHGLAHNVSDSCALNDAHGKWRVGNPSGLVETLAALPFAAQIAVIDACERFWALDVQTSDAEPTEADPFAHWREPVRGLVGRLADD